MFGVVPAGVSGVRKAMKGQWGCPFGLPWPDDSNALAFLFLYLPAMQLYLCL